MTRWHPSIFCLRTDRGDRFTMLEREDETGAIRRGADWQILDEANLRRALAARGEEPESIDRLIAAARKRADFGGE